MYRSLSRACAALVCLFAACDEPFDLDPVEQRAAPLNVADSNRIFAPGAAVDPHRGMFANLAEIGVCWKTKDFAPSGRDAHMREMADRSWARAAPIRFTGWHDCAGSYPDLRVGLSDKDHPHTYWVPAVPLGRGDA